MREIHVVEKGLAMKTVKSDFGVSIVVDIMKNVKKYLENNEADYIVFEAFNVLGDYLNHSQLLNDKNIKLRQSIKMFLDENNEKYIKNNYSEATIELTKRELLVNTGKTTFNLFANSRYSVRHYSEVPVSQIVIKDAVKIAMKTPSSCNMQPWNVHVYNSTETVQDLLKFQNGNRGFNDLIKTLIIVTVDIRNYVGIPERNLRYIDGGLFLMSLVYAFHYKGIGSVILNLALSSEREKGLRKNGDINNFEVLIGMVGVGNYPEYLKVPKSKRKPLSDVIKMH